MAKLIFNKDRFTRVDKWDEDSLSYKGILMSTKLNQKNGQDYKLLDAIDIDWNRAWFTPTSSYINSTEELFDAIETLDKSNELSYITNQLQEVVETYVTHEELNALTLNFQTTLTPGYHVTINEENGNRYISTYDLISNEELYNFSLSYVSYEYLSETVYTKVQTDEFVTEKIKEIIGGADEAFDTIQEISEWIMDQTSFKPINYEDINLNNGVRYYIFNEETNKYSMVNNEYITNNPDEQYYVVASIREELVDIYDQIAYINDERIGQVTWNDEYGMYTYTGILLDIYNLQETDQNITASLDNIKNDIVVLTHLANTSYDMGYTAYLTSYIAYETSNIAYELASNGVGKSIEAYAMAYYAYTEVGVKSYDGFFRPMTEEELQSTPEGTEVYYFDHNIEHYVKVQYYPNPNIEYSIYIEPVEATGLHKSVEEIEQTANTILYNLNVDNSYSLGSYLRLDISPKTYSGDKSRTVYLKASELNYSIDDIVLDLDNEQYNIQQFNINKDGIITGYQMNEILSYVLTIDDIEHI